MKLSIEGILRNKHRERHQHRTGRSEAFCGKSEHLQIAHGHTVSSWKSTRKLQSHPVFQREEKEKKKHLFFVPWKYYHQPAPLTNIEHINRDP